MKAAMMLCSGLPHAMLMRAPVSLQLCSFLLCANRGAVEFLKELASQTGGRFHCSSGGEDGQLAAHRILTEGLHDEDDPVFPDFEGDDLKKLTQEVAKARSFLKQAKSWRLLLEKWNTNQKDNSGFQKNAQD